MKKILYILFCLVPLLTMQSCTERLEENLTNEHKLSTTISVIVPQLPNAHSQTRAMDIKPDVNSLHVAVFDENGYLLEYVEAIYEETELADVNNTEYKYTVDLTPTDFKTTLHFIGNGPASIRFGTETEVMSKLYTEDGEEAYWQRVVLEEGVKFVEKNDNELDLDSDVAAALTGVELIRNFAWINLTESADNFSIISYCVVNTYDKGSIAPYNSAKFGFATFGNDQSYNEIVKGQYTENETNYTGQSYNGFIPAEATLNKTIPDESEWFKVSDNNADNNAYFIYEREKGTSDPPFILVEGKYADNTESSFYKVDLRDDDGSFPIIRNFRYTINLKKVEHAGHKTAQEAANSSGSGDVSTSWDTEKFTNISDNEARIFVSEREITVTEQTDDIEVLFKFLIYDTSGIGITSNGSVTATVDTKGDNVIKSSNIVGTQGDEWYKVVISTNEPVEGFPKSQDIIIKGTYTNAKGEEKSLQRKVTINLRTKYNMQLICDPAEITREMGTPFDVLIKLPNPANMNQSVFPLEFQLEAENQSMTPNLGDDLPAITGKSIVTGKEGKTTIGFIKQLEYSDYTELATDANGYKILPCHFKSNKNIDEAVNGTTIYSQNKYFNLAKTNLGYYAPETFSNLTFSPSNLPNTTEKPVSFTFTMSDLPSQGYVTVGLANLAPAYDETRLTYIGVQDGMACYSFNPTQKTETLELKNTATGVEAKVALSAYHFVDAEKPMDYTPNEFRNLTFTPGTINNKVNENVEFSFTMTNMPTGEVSVVLTHLVKSSTETRLTLTKDEGDVKYYTFKPTTLDNTLQLQNTASGVTAKAQLSATNFPTADKTMKIRNGYVIPAGKIDVGERPYVGPGANDNNSITFTIYTSNSTNNTARITTFETTWKNGKNPADIELSQQQYNAVMGNGGNIYVRFSRNGTNYVATANLQTLLNGDTVELDW